jgi:hypothetical protein
MGWKSAGAHFQQQLAHTVLSGLLYSECELHIDDTLAFAPSEEKRLCRLFERFRKYNVTLNPDKMRDRTRPCRLRRAFDKRRRKCNSRAQSWTALSTLFGVKQFLRFANYFRKLLLLDFGDTASRTGKRLHQEHEASEKAA